MALPNPLDEVVVASTSSCFYPDQTPSPFLSSSSLLLCPHFLYLHPHFLTSFCFTLSRHPQNAPPQTTDLGTLYPPYSRFSLFSVMDTQQHRLIAHVAPNPDHCDNPKRDTWSEDLQQKSALNPALISPDPVLHLKSDLLLKRKLIPELTTDSDNSDVTGADSTVKRCRKHHE